MQILTVIPLTKAFFKDNLTYFSKNPLEPGAIVLAPIRNTPTPALVIKVESASDLKSSLKKSDFQLKKINEVIHESFFTKNFIEACQTTADHFISPIGAVIKEYTPKIILESPVLKTKNKQPEQIEKKQFSTEKYATQDIQSERYSFYRRIIRESLAKKQSVLVCLPNALDVEDTKPELSRGIEEYTFCIHSQLSNKKISDLWLSILDQDRPVVIITTLLFLSIPRGDIGTIILDQERSNTYKNFNRPFIDTRVFVEHLANSLQSKLIIGDVILRAETINRINNNEFIPSTPLKYRLKQKSELLIVSPEPKGQAGGKLVPILSEELVSMIEYSVENKEHLLIISGHRGLASTTVCNDCGTIVSCPNCNTPLTLHRSDEGNAYMCHKCAYLQKTQDECTNCGGWRLALLGSGVDSVSQAIREKFPESLIFQIDSDNTPTTKKAVATASDFLKNKGSILVGTEMIFRYIKEPVTYTALTSFDGLFTIPDFRINEKIIGLIFETQSRATKYCLVQTRRPEDELFEQCRTGNITEFFKSELEDRKSLNYPPYSKLIKLTYNSSKKDCVIAAKKITADIPEYQPLVVPKLEAPVDNYSISIILKLPLGPLPETLLSYLRNLPPAWVVTVDPDSII